MSLLRQKSSIIREKRLFAISAYFGKTETLLNEYAEDGQYTQRVRTFTQEIASDILTALNIVTTIKNAAIIVHGAAGCGTGRLSFNYGEENNGKWAVTNLNERDSIMGSESKLGDAVRQIYKLHHPEIIFIISTPIVAINNDDIESVVDSLNEELGIPVVPVYTVGFRSKISVSGQDLVSHSILRYILKSKSKEVSAKYINLLSVTENKSELNEVIRLLNELNLETNVFPRYTSLANIEKLSGAAFSVSINPDESNYPGKVIEELFNIPYIQAESPIGIENTTQWLTDVAIATGHKTEVQQLISREKDKLTTLLKRREFNKPKVFISLPPAYAIAVLKLSEELGFEVVGVKVSYLDVQHLSYLEKNKSRNPTFEIFVGDGQYFEEENVIRKIQPTLYVGGKNSDFSIAVRNGIPTVNIEDSNIIGFQGVINFAAKVNKTLSNTFFIRSLAQAEPKTYTKEWLKKSTNWFIKQEVK